MTYKTLLLHVDDSKVCVERTDVGSILRKLLTLISLDSTASTHPFRATYKYRQRWSGRPLSLGDGEAGNDLAERDKERKITHRGVIEERRGLPSGEAWFACKGLIGALLRDAVNLPAVPSSLPDTRERTIGLYSTDHGSGRGHHALGRVLRRDPEANMIILSRTKEDKARSSELSVRDIDRAVKEMCPAHSPARSFSSCLRQGPPNARHEPLTEAGAERTL